MALRPVVLHEQPNEGRTIIEKFEDFAHVGFAVVLLTPDDTGRLQDDAGEYRPRARQNVIFEFGYFIGKLGRERVCALVQGDLERPSDYDGVLYIQLDDSEGWKMRLVRVEERRIRYRCEPGICNMNARIDIPSDRIADFCRRWQITRLALFGSILRDDFGPDSDIDVLVKFDETAHPTLFDMSRMEAELKAILGREVDLVSQRGIERSRNFLRRKAILESAEPVYGS